MSPDNLDSILKNKWELYDVKKMFRLKMGFTIVISIILWFFMVFAIGMILSIAMPAYDTFLVKATISTVIVVVVMIIAAVKVRQMDRDKAGWYFSALQDPRLDRDGVMALVKQFLSEHKYNFVEEETHRTLTLWITYFDIAGTDFKVRLWFSVIGGTPVAEIGFGPETMINKAHLQELMVQMSQEFNRRYGAQPMPPPQQPPQAAPAQGPPPTTPPGPAAK